MSVPLTKYVTFVLNFKVILFLEITCVCSHCVLRLHSGNKWFQFSGLGTGHSVFADILVTVVNTFSSHFLSSRQWTIPDQHEIELEASDLREQTVRPNRFLQVWALNLGRIGASDR